MRRRKRYGLPHVPTNESGIERMVDLMDNAPVPIDELPEGEPIERLVRSMAADTRSRFQAGGLL